MSIITVQLGQCGNQIGGQLFSTLLDDACCKNSHVSKARNMDYIQEVQDRFFVTPEDNASARCPLLEARAVMVDMESKVINQTCAEAKRSGSWMYPNKQQFTQKRGSGNNWANGYCIHGSSSHDDIMNMIQREMEKCDHFGGFLILLSLAGGTGSGVGTYVTQCLRDEYPKAFLLNQVVWPYNTGEVIVQNYNALLTLSRLYQTVDAVLVMENDGLQKICSQLLNIKQISFQDINKVITHKLASMLQPAMCDTGNGYSTQNYLGHILEHVVPHPEYKLLTLKNIPQISEKSMEYSIFQWHGLLKHLRQMLLADSAMEEGIDWQIKLGDETPRGSIRHNRCMANMLFLRGKELDLVDKGSFADPNLYTSWTNPGMAFSTWTQPRAFNQYEKSASILSNSKSPIGPLNHVITKAWSMFSARAYVHQYTKHGLTEEDFIDSFATLEQVLANYRKL